MIDGPAFPEFRFRGRSNVLLQFAPDWLAVPDRPTAESYVELGYREDRTIICGHPHFDRVREECRRLDKEEVTALRSSVLGDEVGSRLVVVFIAELSDGLRPRDFQWTPECQLRGRGDSQQRTQIVLEEVLDAVAYLDPKPYIVLRLAPKNRVGEFSNYAGEIDYISHQGPVLPLLYVANLVIGMTSMPLLEAAIMGRSTLSVLPLPEQRRWLPSIDLGLTRLATTREEVRRQIGLGLENGPPMVMGDLIPVGAVTCLSTFLGGLEIEGPNGA